MRRERETYALLDVVGEQSPHALDQRGDATGELTLDVLEGGQREPLDGDGVREDPGMDPSVSSIFIVSHKSVSLEFALV